MGNAAYDKKHCRRIAIKLNIRIDDDIIKQFDSVENKQAYLKDLVREYNRENSPDIDDLMDNALDEL